MKNLCDECYRTTCQLHPDNRADQGNIQFRMQQCHHFLTSVIDIDDLDKACDSLQGQPYDFTVDNIKGIIAGTADRVGAMVGELNAERVALGKMVQAFMQITAETEDEDTHRACDQLIGENDELLTKLGITL